MATTNSTAMMIVCPSCAAVNRVPFEKLSSGGKCGKCSTALFSAKPVDLTAANFDTHASRSDIPLLIDFWASWCGPCRQMGPAFAAAATHLEPRMRLGKLDTEVEQAIAARYGIRSIPTLVIVSKGREVARKSGAMPEQAIVAWANQLLGSCLK